MSLREKLKPQPKAGKVGKIVPCPRCGRDAEHYSANFVMCAVCDAPKPKLTGAFERARDEAFEAACAADLEFDDEPTNPGGWTFAGPRWYRCLRCTVQTKTDPSLVANGKTCSCGGALKVCP
jgi:hypothetical protein